jgi:hypothetical protein
MLPGRHLQIDGFDELFRNPLTGDWPILDSRDFSPGDFFFRILSEAEIEHFSQKIPQCRELWIDRRQQDPVSGEWRSMQPLFDGVLYVRMYGLQGVLISGFHDAYVLDE